MVRVTEVFGDLFSSNASLVHCISADARMSRGIALQFRHRFGRVHEIRSRITRMGSVVVLQHQNRFIYNLITKWYHYDKPTYASLVQSLYQMKQHIITNRVSCISMPQIGCGLDQLSWSNVKALLYHIFDDCNLDIYVYQLPRIQFSAYS